MTETFYARPSVITRAIAYFIDHFFFSTILMAVFVAAVPFSDLESADSTSSLFPWYIWLMLAGYFLLFLAKDSVKGISPGKWVMGIMVRDDSNMEQVPSFGKLMLRNLTLPLWLIEGFVALASKDQKRWGDQLAHTLVLENPNKGKPWARVSVSAVLLLAFIPTAFFMGGRALKSSGAYQASIEYISHDPGILTATGGIKGYGNFPKGQINITNGHGTAVLEIFVIGNETDVTVTTYLSKEPGDEVWTVQKMVYQ